MIRRLFNEVFKAAESHMIQRVVVDRLIRYAPNVDRLRFLMIAS